jgi:hypothetical protein
VNRVNLSGFREFLVFERGLSYSALSRPEHRINAEFAHFVDEYDKVMTENFAECFVDHRHRPSYPTYPAQVRRPHAGSFCRRPREFAPVQEEERKTP